MGWHGSIKSAYGNACTCQIRTNLRLTGTSEQTQSVLPCRPGYTPFSRSEISFNYFASFCQYGLPNYFQGTVLVRKFAKKRRRSDRAATSLLFLHRGKQSIRIVIAIEGSQVLNLLPKPYIANCQVVLHGNRDGHSPFCRAIQLGKNKFIHSG